MYLLPYYTKFLHVIFFNSCYGDMNFYILWCFCLLYTSWTKDIDANKWKFESESILLLCWHRWQFCCGFCCHFVKQHAHYKTFFYLCMLIYVYFPQYYPVPTSEWYNLEHIVLSFNTELKKHSKCFRGWLRMRKGKRTRMYICQLLQACRMCIKTNSCL